MDSFCPRCGSQRVGALRFCRKCGWDFDADLAGADSESAAMAPAPPPAVTPPPPSTPSATAQHAPFPPPSTPSPPPPLAPLVAPPVAPPPPATSAWAQPAVAVAPGVPPPVTSATTARPWYRKPAGIGAAIVGIIVVAAAVSSRGAPGGIAVATGSPPPATQAAQQSQRPTPTAAPQPTAPARTPIPLPTEVDPDLAYAVWLSTFGDNWSDISDEIADAIETDFYWVESVDTIRFDSTTNRMIIEATVDYESIYASDRLEWQTDTWDLYQSWSRNVWSPFIEGFDSGGEVNFTPDWPTWTPTLVLRANAGRLRVECPGSLIYAVSQREASQSDYLAECTFKN